MSEQRILSERVFTYGRTFRLL